MVNGAVGGRRRGAGLGGGWMAGAAGIGCGRISGASVGASASIGSALDRMQQFERLFVLGRRQRVFGADVVPDAGQTIDHQAERVLHGVERLMGAGDVLAQRFERRVVRARPARLLDVAEQVGEPAFDRLQLAGRRGLARVLDAVDLVGERGDQRLQPRRQRGVVRPLGQCQGQRVDAQRQIGEHVAFRPGVADALDLVGERLHLRRQPPDRLIGGDVVDHAAQGDDRAFELAQGRRGLSPPRSDRSSAPAWRPRRYSRPGFPPVSVHAARRALR